MAKVKRYIMDIEEKVYDLDLEKIITDFPYKNKDANNRPATLRAKQMSNKGSRRVIGTFAEIANLKSTFRG